MTDSTVRCDRVGWPREKLKLEYQQATLPDDIAQSKSSPFVSSAKSGIAFSAHIFALCNYLGDRISETRTSAYLTLDLVEDYLFGDWRDQYRSKEFKGDMPLREYWDIKALWDGAIRPGFLWSAVLGEWDRFARVGTYMRDDVRIDETRENRAWYLILSGVARGRPWEETLEHREFLQNGKAKRERLLLAALEAIVGGSLDSAQKELDAYYTHYKRTEAKQDMIPSKLLTDGSVLVHLARHRGLDVVVPEKVVDHFIEVPAS